MKREEPKYRSARERAETHESGFQSTTIKAPEGIKFFKLKSEGSKLISILPYTVGLGAGGNPYADEGEMHYERTFFVHRGIGANESSYVCPRKTMEKECPICEYRSKLAKTANADEQLVKDLAPRERQLFLVYDHSDPEAGVQLWDVSYHVFGKVLDQMLKNADEDDGYDLFYHPDNEKGFALKLLIEEKHIGKVKFMAVENIMFKKRKEDLPEEILENLPCLDDLLIVLKADKLDAIFKQIDPEDSEETEEEAPAKKKKAAVEEEEEEEEPVKKKKKPADEEEEEEEAPVKKKKKVEEEEEEEEEDPVKKKKVEEEEEEEEEDPVKKKKVPVDEDENWDDPEPVKKKKKPADEEEE